MTDAINEYGLRLVRQGIARLAAAAPARFRMKLPGGETEVFLGVILSEQNSANTRGRLSSRDGVRGQESRIGGI